jgi:glutamate decarboxylase
LWPYNSLRQGRAGYTEVMQSLSSTARWLGEQLRVGEHCELISDGSAIPVISFRLAKNRGYTGFDISHELRGYGWQVPAYTVPRRPALRAPSRTGSIARLAASEW